MKSAIIYAPLCGLMALGLAAPAFAKTNPLYPTYTVGPQANGTYVMSTGQIVSPAGTALIMGSPVRVKAVAVNPANPNSAAALLMGAAEAVEIFNPANGTIVQQYSPFGDNEGSFTGITYSPDGSKLIFSQDDSNVAVATVDPSTGLLSDDVQIAVAPSQSYINCAGITVGLPSDPVTDVCGNFYNGNTYTSNPGGIAVTADGGTAYAVLNANNTVQPIDLRAKPPTLKGSQFQVGNAPNSIVIDGSTAYVSNEGGRVATSADFTNISNGTPIVANTVNGSAATGTVSVVDLNNNKVKATIQVGLHPTGMTINNGLLYVCNTYSDTISVIDLSTNLVVNTINLALPLGLSSSSFGAEPQNLVIVGTTAYVTLYTANAIAVVDLAQTNPTVLGYIPTASTPTTIAYDATANKLVVANDKGLGTWGSEGHAHGLTGYNSHQDTGTVNLIPVPTTTQLAAYTQTVVNNNHWNWTANVDSAFGGSPTAKPVAIPKKIGSPSLIKHVFLIVRENRTYDQILGDVKKGNGDPALAIFGGNVTPNAHALVKRFPLLDNYYNPSRQSADGHNWLVQAMAPYMDDIQSPDWIRSYPANGLDALAYNPKGFLWDAAEANGLSVKIFGEYVEYAEYTFTQPNGSNAEPSWSQWYADSQAFEAGQESTLYYGTTPNTISEIPSVQNYSVPHFPVFDLGLPDQWRVDQWLQNFNADVAAGTVPNLSVLWIMCDHTGGPPTIDAEQADNDLAVGRIVDYISHSNVWPSSAIFITEDDAQDGVDHVDGHRSPGYIVSPYVVENKTFSNYFSQVNFTRTIEQILGLPPINQFDLTATPMFDVFTNTPDLTPWTHVPNQIPLNQGVTDSDTTMTPIAKAWAAAKTEMFKGNLHKADSVDPYTLNHLDWYEATNFQRPYPGEKSVRWPSEFENRIQHPNFDLDDQGK
jgi:YVTN family beta-propeller protein